MITVLPLTTMTDLDSPEPEDALAVDGVLLLDTLAAVAMLLCAKCLAPAQATIIIRMRILW